MDYWQNPAQTVMFSPQGANLRRGDNVMNGNQLETMFARSLVPLIAVKNVWIILTILLLPTGTF